MAKSSWQTLLVPSWVLANHLSLNSLVVTVADECHWMSRMLTLARTSKVLNQEDASGVLLHSD